MLTYDETVKRMASSAAVVKLICGVANNAAWMVVLDAHDHAKRCRGYRHGVKHQFKAAIQALKDYERRLLYAEENRMFHLADMSEKVRKKYGDISDREYYDFWASMGGAAYGIPRYTNTPSFSAATPCILPPSMVRTGLFSFVPQLHKRWAANANITNFFMLKLLLYN